MEQDELSEFLATGKELLVEGLTQEMMNVGEENMKEDISQEDILQEDILQGDISQGTQLNKHLFTSHRYLEVSNVVSAQIGTEVKDDDSQTISVGTGIKEAKKEFNCDSCD